MKLASVKELSSSRVRWGVWEEDGFFPLDADSPYPSLLSLILDGEEGIRYLESRRGEINQSSPSKFLPHDEVKILPPYRPLKNIICVGKNYAEHAMELSGGDRSAIPEHPLFFTKSPTSVIGHMDEIDPHEQWTKALDYEGELLVIIGREGKNIPEEQAMDHIFGYSILNDITARDLQKRHQQFFKGKSLDTFAPFGPYIIPKTYLPDPQNLRIQTFVNGECRQDANTQEMIFSIPRLISILSQGMTLEPGDMIATGTPSGVGQGFNPPRYLHSGNEIRVRIEGIGELVNRVK